MAKYHQRLTTEERRKMHEYEYKIHLLRQMLHELQYKRAKIRDRAIKRVAKST